MMNKLSSHYALLLAALLSLGLSACNPEAQTKQDSTQSAPLEGANIGGDFILTNQDGQSVSSTSFKGQYRIIYFGYTYCPDVCPVDVQRLMQGLMISEKADPALAKKIQPIFITIDPERDRPAQLKQYVEAFHPRLIGLTGTAAQIKEAADKFLVVYNKRENESASEYLMDHTNLAYLIGPQGEPIALLPTGNDATPQQIADEIEKWTS